MLWVFDAEPGPMVGNGGEGDRNSRTSAATAGFIMPEDSSPPLRRAKNWSPGSTLPGDGAGPEGG